VDVSVTTGIEIYADFDLTIAGIDVASTTIDVLVSIFRIRYQTSRSSSTDMSSQNLGWELADVCWIFDADAIDDTQWAPGFD